MPSLSIEQVKEYITDYVKIYKIAPYLHFKVRESAAELYGDEHNELFIQAAYEPYAVEVDGKVGRVDINTGTNPSFGELHKSLNHEIIGHYGLTTYTPQEKRQILENIIIHKDELSDLWEYVEKNYKNEPLYLKAEEVFCLVAESITPAMHLEKPIDEFCFDPLTKESLTNLVLHTANQLALGFSKRQTFYLDDITQIQLNIERSQQHLELEDELEDDLER